jgi:hypothetical protein
MKQDRQFPGNSTNKRRSCRKEISTMQFTKRNRDERSQEESRVSRVAIYLCEPSPKDGVTEPSIPLPASSLPPYSETAQGRDSRRVPRRFGVPLCAAGVVSGAGGRPGAAA